MSISQISVFLESQPGRLGSVLNLFEQAGINVRGYSASDTGDYGIVRFVVDDPERGIEVLKEAGAAATLAEVLCAKLTDKPGELLRLMSVMADCGINVVYSYSLISTYIALSVEDVEAAERLLANKPIELVSIEDLAQPVGGCL